MANTQFGPILSILALILASASASALAAASSALEVQIDSRRASVDEQLSPRAQDEARSLIPAFEKIESYLVASRSTKSTSLMSQIKDIYQKKKFSLLQKLKSDPDKNNSRLKRALKLFISLPKAAKACNYYGYEVLAKNHIAMEADMHAHHSPRRGLKLLREYSQKHASICLGKYSENFVAINEESGWMQTEQFGLIRRIFEALGTSDCLTPPKQHDDGTVENFSLKTSPICIKHLMRQLLLVHKSKTNGQLVRGEYEAVWRMVTDSLQEYLVIPCSNYYELYKGVFAPALYDAAISDKPAEFPAPELPKEGPFRDGLQNFKACESVIKQNEFLQRLIGLNIPK